MISDVESPPFAPQSWHFDFILSLVQINPVILHVLYHFLLHALNLFSHYTDAFFPTLFVHKEIKTIHHMFIVLINGTDGACIYGTSKSAKSTAKSVEPNLVAKT